MNSRDRVKRAVRFQGPDRIPHMLPDGKENDLLWLWIPGPGEIQPWTDYQGHQRRIDAWGVVWQRASEETFGEAVEWPIKDLTRQANYVFPDMNNPAHFESTRKTIAQNNASGNPRYCLGVMPFSSLHAGTHSIIGLEHLLAEYFEHPDDLKALIARLSAKRQESIRRLADCGCDGVMGYDDWGLQDRLMISVRMVEEFFLPHYRREWALAHELGMDVWMHSCGYIIELLPRLIEAGLNVVQMDQQENMGLDLLNERVGGKIAFWCPVDIQKTMVNGSPRDVDAYVKRMVETLGAHDGGLISMSYTSPEAVHHTPENTAAMCTAFRRYGIYRR